MCHSIELIGYQTQAHWQNKSVHSVNYKGSIIKSVSAFFGILTGYFLINLSSSSSEEYSMAIALKIPTGESILNFKNSRHMFVSQHLRNVQAKFHRNLPKFGTLLIPLFD